MKVAIIGFGDRGQLYSTLFRNENTEIVAIIDLDKSKLGVAINKHGIPADRCFSTEEEFWAKGKIADLLVISVLDQFHFEIAMKAINLGYDILLEKPISTTLDYCRQIECAVKEKGVKLFLCYVLRYAPFYIKLKELIDSGKYGQLVSINATEGVGYWHQAHSFVRGNWRKAEESTPMIVAKCSHDMDVLYWLAGANPVAVSSMGSLSYFKKENAPDGSAKHCCDCLVTDKCPYYNFKFYSELPWWIEKVGYFNGDVNDKEAIKKCLADKSNPYSRCVFHCDNDVVDHQVTNIEFDNGVTAHLTMTAFTKECYRKIHLHFTLGDIYGDMNENILHCNLFSGEINNIDIGKLGAIDGHGGGDAFMVKDIVRAYNENSQVKSNNVDDAMASHYLAFYAEESRINGGKVIYFNKK